MKHRCLAVLAVWIALGASFALSTNVRASLWATGLLASMPDTWVGQLLPTGSMEPTLNDQDWLIYQHVPFSQVHVGDIISFSCPREHILVTHRVVGRERDGTLITRGDANADSDPWCVGPKNYRGMLIAVYPRG